MAPLSSREAARLDAADDQSLIREQLFFSFWKTGFQLVLRADALTIKLVRTRALKRNERDVLLGWLDRFTNLAELPARLAFDVQDAKRSFDYVDECVLLVVFNGQLAVERRYFNCVTMSAHSRRSDLEIHCLRIVAAQIELYRLDRKSTRLNSSHTDISRMP